MKLVFQRNHRRRTNLPKILCFLVHISEVATISYYLLGGDGNYIDYIVSHRYTC